MKKIGILLLLSLIITLCSCGNSNTQESEKLVSTKMESNILDSLIILIDSNTIVIDALDNCIEGDMESAKSKYIEALADFKILDNKIGEIIDSPNFINKDIKKLIKSTEDTINLLNGEMSEKKVEILLQLVVESNYLHLGLMESVQAFLNLWNIREYDLLSDEEADKRVKEFFWKFGFADNVECPENIEEYELYLIWAKQFSDEFVETEDFTKELQSLREKDSLGDKEINKEWADFIETYIGTENGAAMAAPNIL